MKAIKNIGELRDLLYKDNPEWEIEVYKATGVLVIFQLQKYVTLFSSCGYIDLDIDAEYRSIDGEDTTEYCEIHTTQELIEYIKSMNSYWEYLVDLSFGHFTKAELFWGIYERILTPIENQKHADGSIRQEWGLYSIHPYQNHTELNMALIDYDSADIWIDINEETTLTDALNSLVNELNQEKQYHDDLPYLVVAEKSFEVPSTYEALIKQVMPGGLFAWLNE